MIPGDQPEEGIDGCGGEDFEKRKVLRLDETGNATKNVNKRSMIRA